jgi:ribosomal protein S18 acetylase RimI-like enzyme
VAVLARGFCGNPVPTALFGAEPERQKRCLEAMFGGLFRVMRAQTPLVALDGATIVGMTGILPPGRCQPTNSQRLELLPSMLSTGPGSLLRAVRLSTAWAKLDPTERHSHLGPLAVDAHLKGRGIGTQILGAYCRRLDEANLTGYLETETEDNVRLYMRFGFKVIAEQSVIGVPNWFMRRPEPRPAST